jgi:SAM-dependent methyltransferase
MSEAAPDETGRAVRVTAPLKVLWDDGVVLYPQYESFGHSLWRAQELSLFRAQKATLRTPVVDFGCGDGSFASLIYDRIDYGVDVDEGALAVARRYGLYARLVHADDWFIPLPDGTAGSIVSNSVLEHLVHLDRILAELHRILAPDGMLLFTVPVKQYERDLARYIGARAARKVNYETYHRNLLEPEDWRELLQRNGFTVVSLRQFQPARFTFWYRMCRLVGSRFGISFFAPSIKEMLWARYRSRIVALVRESITGTEAGGNIFVTARKVSVGNVGEDLSKKDDAHESD